MQKRVNLSQLAVNFNLDAVSRIEDPASQAELLRVAIYRWSEANTLNDALHKHPFIYCVHLFLGANDPFLQPGDPIFKTFTGFGTDREGLQTGIEHFDAFPEVIHMKVDVG